MIPGIKRDETSGIRRDDPRNQARYEMISGIRRDETQSPGQARRDLGSGEARPRVRRDETPVSGEGDDLIVETAKLDPEIRK
ncbi:hypothetical protein NN561_012457 [Cricetulus griseus]